MKCVHNLIHLCISLPSCFPLLNKIFKKSKNKSWFNKDNMTISLHNWLIYWSTNCYFLFFLIRSSFLLSEMFQSCSGPDNQWVISQGDDGQGLYDSGPLPHSWPQFCPPRPSGAIRHSRSQRPYGGAYTRAYTGAYTGAQNPWRVGSHNRMLR